MGAGRTVRTASLRGMAATSDMGLHQAPENLTTFCDARSGRKAHWPTSAPQHTEADRISVSQSPPSDSQRWSLKARRAASHQRLDQCDRIAATHWVVSVWGRRSPWSCRNLWDRIAGTQGIVATSGVAGGGTWGCRGGHVGQRRSRAMVRKATPSASRQALSPRSTRSDGQSALGRCRAPIGDLKHRCGLGPSQILRGQPLASEQQRAFLLRLALLRRVRRLPHVSPNHAVSEEQGS